jgi:hypothetical protein
MDDRKRKLYYMDSIQLSNNEETIIACVLGHERYSY